MLHGHARFRGSISTKYVRAGRTAPAGDARRRYSQQTSELDVCTTSGGEPDCRLCRRSRWF